MYVCVRYKESDRSCVYVSDTRRVIGHVCMSQIHIVIGHVCMC